MREENGNRNGLVRVQPTAQPMAQPRSPRSSRRGLRRAMLALAMTLSSAWVSAGASAPADPPPVPPLPFGTAVTPDLHRLFVVHGGQASVSVIDTDPASPAYLREIAVIPVGHRPAGIASGPDGADVFVANSGDDSVSIIEVASLTVRKTLTSPLLHRPFDIAVGPKEVVNPAFPFPMGIAFNSGTFHAYISNSGGSEVLIYESGPAGTAGLGFDDIIGAVDPGSAPFDPGWLLERLLEPRGIAFDPQAPLDGFSQTVGCFVAHRDVQGHGAVTRIKYAKDSKPGENLVDTTTTPPGFLSKTFAITAQYVSTHLGAGLDVALADENLSVSHPTLLYLSMAGGVIDVFDAELGTFIKRYEPGFDVPDLNVFLQP